MVSSDYQFKLYAYYAQMVALISSISDAELHSLRQWEDKHVDGKGVHSTSDWPGWEKYIDSRPVPPEKIKDTWGYVYLIRCGIDKYKIGISRCVETRIAVLQTGSPEQLFLVHKFFSSTARLVERTLHDKFDAQRIHGEWFALNNSGVEFICSYTDNFTGNDRHFQLTENSCS